MHGYSLNLDSWHFQRAAYRGQVRTVFYDQRSHGRSDRSSDDHCTIDQLGHDLRRVIEDTVPGRCVVVGHSMGGMTVISLAELYPEMFGDKVVGAALIATTAGGLDPGRILFPMLPLGLGGRFMGRAVRTLDRGHKVVDLARAWGHAVADVVTDRYAFGADPVPASHVEFVYSMLNSTPVRRRGGLLPGLRDARQVRAPRAAGPRAHRDHLRHRATRSPRSATAASCTAGSRAPACWSARAPATW